MKALTRTFQALAVLGALLSAALFWSVSQRDQDAQVQLDFAERQVKALQAHKAELQKELTELSQRLDSLQDEREAATAKHTSLAAQLGQLQRENLRLVEDSEARRNAEQRLQRENARLKEELAETRARSVPQEQVARYEERVATLERELLELQQTRSSATTAVSSALEPPPANPSLTGSVLKVGKGASFVVLDIGYSQGVRLQSELLVQHADSSIAKIQVTEVKENLSIARVLPESLIKMPQVGDAVSSLN